MLLVICFVFFWFIPYYCFNYILCVGNKNDMFFVKNKNIIYPYNDINRIRRNKGGNLKRKMVAENIQLRYMKSDINNNNVHKNNNIDHSNKYDYNLYLSCSNKKREKDVIKTLCAIKQDNVVIKNINEKEKERDIKKNDTDKIKSTNTNEHKNEDTNFVFSYDKKLNNYSEFNIYMENNNIEEYISDVNISTEEICNLYEDMYLGRLFENLVAKLYYNKRVNGFVHLYNGQEAVSTGIIKNLKNSDFVTSTYRDHVHALSKGVHANKILNELYGNYYGSTNKGKGGSMHIYSKENNFIGGFGFIGEQIPIAVGLAYSILYKNEFQYNLKNASFTSNTNTNTNNHIQDNINLIHMNNSQNIDVVVCFLGDGTTNIGQFFESLNLASSYNLPIIFVIENNNWAIGMESSRSSSDDLMNNYSKGKAFNIDTFKVDGNDVLSIYKLAKKKIQQIRNRTSGPVIIEAITYRAKGHSLADPDELRIKEEKTSWKKRDPILFLSTYMKKYNLVQESYFEQVKKKIQTLLQQAEVDAEQNSKKGENLDICNIIQQNIFAPSNFTPYQSEYQNYKQFDDISNDELKEYYQEVLKEIERKKQNKKIDPNDKFDQKKLPLIID
ncbi:pyruvate dehydrogenase E1 component subunit alpha [Plasmodium gaboni]|uniref:Pyruvate dehydrogenase E1 component subunit alpha n=1 Tax=Plasmodium gaboni TaxID=647221 RepID=A0A151LJ15_9APIC|nr:pyruvate dehydrogenase E1 component subunit alpha [Plasmodium gaboni]KYN98887.1 pyruvate dehydrogenase E1 component subunit alpha [Plasmodium gaboni]